MDQRDLLVLYAMKFAGTPYKYGGNNPLQGGIDCSGFVCEILRFAGLVKNREDLTAQQLYDKFLVNGKPGLSGKGALAFYGKARSEISHVAFMVSTCQILEAGGGDQSTDTLAEAADRSALVRGRMVDYRLDLLTVIMPNYWRFE